MTRTVKFGVGAPSVTGIDANDTVTKEFQQNDFPLSVSVTNRAMFSLVLPDKFHLKPLHDLKDCTATVTVNSLSDMHRMISDLESIAENHKHAELVIIDAGVPNVTVDTPVTEPTEPVANEATTGKKAKGG